MRVAGGWQSSGPSLPINQNLFVRAQGYYQTGYFGGSGSIVESIRRVYLAAQPFTDDPLTAGASVISAVHITELRTRTDALRVRSGLAAYPYTDPTITAGATIVLAQHLLDVRAALSQAYVAAALTPPTFTATVAIGATITAAALAEIRAAITAIE